MFETCIFVDAEHSTEPKESKTKSVTTGLSSFVENLLIFVWKLYFGNNPDTINLQSVNDSEEELKTFVCCFVTHCCSQCGFFCIFFFKTDLKMRLK